jgi:hypothetical protein
MGHLLLLLLHLSASHESLMSLSAQAPAAAIAAAHT